MGVLPPLWPGSFSSLVLLGSGLLPSLPNCAPNPGWSLPSTRSYTLAAEFLRVPASEALILTLTLGGNFPCHCHRSANNEFPNPCSGINSQRCALGLHAADIKPSATCLAVGGSLWPTGTLPETDPSPAACRSWIDFYRLVIAVVSALWVVTARPCQNICEVWQQNRGVGSLGYIMRFFPKMVPLLVLCGKPDCQGILSFDPVTSEEGGSPELMCP